MSNDKRIIDLRSEQGNAFFLMAIAKDWAKQLDRDGSAITAEMRSSDYKHLVEVFEREFGSFCKLVGKEII